MGRLENNATPNQACSNLVPLPPTEQYHRFVASNCYTAIAPTKSSLSRHLVFTCIVCASKPLWSQLQTTSRKWFTNRFASRLLNRFSAFTPVWFPSQFSRNRLGNRLGNRLKCFYRWRHAHDKMYQALTLLSGYFESSKMGDLTGLLWRTHWRWLIRLVWLERLTLIWILFGLIQMDNVGGVATHWAEASGHMTNTVQLLPL